MYSRYQLAQKYIRYYLTASNGKGHGIHSPFVFDFITKVLRDKKKHYQFDQIEGIRQQLQSNKTLIEVEDFGAGSSVIKTSKRVTGDIARSSLKSAKYAQLLFRMVHHYKPATIIELGTSLGVTTSYLATGNPHAKVISFEGAKNIAAIARSGFQQLNLQNIELVEGDFAHTLPARFSQLKQVDLAFIDGNHRKIPTLDYFEQLLKISTEDTLLIFDDIHWSAEMEDAWKCIRQHPAVTLTIDLFFVGIVCVNSSVKVKQHFSISY